METENKYKNLCTQAEYARFIGKSRARVSQMINEKKITAVFVSGIKLIKLTESEMLKFSKKFPLLSDENLMK